MRRRKSEGPGAEWLQGPSLRSAVTLYGQKSAAFPVSVFPRSVFPALGP